jgi:hypothetical protein
LGRVPLRPLRAPDRLYARTRRRPDRAWGSSPQAPVGLPRISSPTRYAAGVQPHIEACDVPRNAEFAYRHLS